MNTAFTSSLVCGEGAVPVFFFGKRDYRALDSPSSNLRSIASISSMLWSTSTLGFLWIAECDGTGGTGAIAGPSGIEGADGGPWHAAHIRSAT
jgi:hypothetical protein